MPATPTSWHRVPFLWLFIAFPLAAVIGGFTMLWLALDSDDGLVIDDYYRHGKEINRELRRDAAASALNLSALVEFDEARRKVQVRLTLPLERLPAQLKMQLLHATRAGYDHHQVLGRTATGVYRATVSGLAPGHYYVQLAAEDWRLVGSLHLPGDARVEIRSNARH